MQAQCHQREEEADKQYAQPTVKRIISPPVNTNSGDQRVAGKNRVEKRRGNPPGQPAPEFVALVDLQCRNREMENGRGNERDTDVAELAPGGRDTGCLRAVHERIARQPKRRASGHDEERNADARVAFTEQNLHAQRQHRARGEQGRQREQADSVGVGCKNFREHDSRRAIRAAAELLAACDEGGKYAALKFLARRQNFRMPLDAEHKAVAGAFDPLDHTVSGDGIDNEAAAESLHRLMVRGVHRQARSFHDGEKARAGFDVNRMTAMPAPGAALVRSGVSKLRSDVLVERTA